MKKLKYFILGSIIVAVVLLVSGSILGGFDQLDTLYQRGEFDIEVPFVETVDIKNEYSNIENLEIDCQIGTVDIVEYEGTVIKVEGKNISSTIKVEKDNQDIKTYSVQPKKKKVDGEVTYQYGIGMAQEVERGIVPAFTYMVKKTGSIFKQMAVTVGYLFTGGISVSQLSGPVGIFSVVGDQSSGGLVNIIYLIAFLSINVGFINLLPLPAFDGGHILFIIIEKIKGSPVKPETENMIHTIGLFLLMLLMVVITFNDIVRLFK